MYACTLSQLYSILSISYDKSENYLSDLFEGNDIDGFDCDQGFSRQGKK